MVVTPSGITTLLPLNSFASIRMPFTTTSGFSVTLLLSHLVSANANPPMLSTVSGIFKASSSVQPLNAPTSISVTLSGIFTDVSDEQRANIHAEIFSKLFETETLFRLVHS